MGILGGMLWPDWRLVFPLGLVLGALLGWFLRSARRWADVRLEEELRNQLRTLEGELARSRKGESEAMTAKAQADARQAALEREVQLQSEELKTWGRQMDSQRSELRDLTGSLARAKAETEAGRQLLEEQRKVHAANELQLRERQESALAELKRSHEQALEALRVQFKALAADALAANSPEFLRLANETLSRFRAESDGESAQRQAGLVALVKPLEEQLRQYQQRLQQSEAQQQAALGQVRQYLESLAAQSQTLSGETQRLRVVLSSGQARGRWGEETLRRVVEAAQLSAHCDFTEQVRVGDAKPDLVVHLPGNRIILVDSKVPDLDFLDALATADDAKRSAALVAHARKLRETIRQLADRDYPRQFAQALDYVVLFLPAESLFSAALEGDRDLIVWAAQHRVLLTTPASLIALLRSVAVSWQQQEQSVNARQIGEAARQLFERVVKFTDHFEAIRDGLNRANRAYDAAVGSYERSVRPSGERLQKLGGLGSERELPPVAPLESALRLPPREGTGSADTPAKNQTPTVGEGPLVGVVQKSFEL
ncbi:MAG: DNA recombination protein RmuC [Verrucomicrobia bacterium]|nr:DNA recombination protein RmuC [Verrucomicrobiota bacterium]